MKLCVTQESRYLNIVQSITYLSTSHQTRYISTYLQHDHPFLHIHHCWTLLLNRLRIAGQVSKIKDDLKQCANSGQDLNSCLTDLAVAIKPYMKTGVPELGIPQADPLILDEIAFDLKNPIIDVHVEFTENEVTGKY